MTRDHRVSASMSFIVGLSLAAVTGMGAYGDDASDRARVCARGYAASIRPPFEVTHAIKLKMLARLGISPDGAAFYRLDHIVSLELDGEPEDYANLQLQPLESAHRKDLYEEDALHAAVCAKKHPLPLSVAQQVIRDHYTTYVPGTNLVWVPPARISWDFETQRMPGGGAGRVDVGRPRRN